jgi:hypothetical protein
MVSHAPNVLGHSIALMRFVGKQAEYYHHSDDDS